MRKGEAGLTTDMECQGEHGMSGCVGGHVNGFGLGAHAERSRPSCCSSCLALRSCARLIGSPNTDLKLARLPSRSGATNDIIAKNWQPCVPCVRPRVCVRRRWKCAATVVQGRRCISHALSKWGRHQQSLTQPPNNPRDPLTHLVHVVLHGGARQQHPPAAVELQQRANRLVAARVLQPVPRWFYGAV